MSQQRPPGTPWIITPEWIAWARDRMDELRITQAELADRVGASKMAISDIFRGETAHTRLLPRINAVLGGVPPRQVAVSDVVDELKARIDAAWEGLSDDERALLVQVASALGAKKTDE